MYTNAGALFCPLHGSKDRQFETNLFAVWGLILAVLPAMRIRRSGRIVNVSSVAAFFAPKYMMGYAATKHALDALSVEMDLELKDFNVRVTSVAPVAFGTALSANVTPPPSDGPYECPTQVL